MPKLTENFDQLKMSSEIRSSDQFPLLLEKHLIKNNKKVRRLTSKMTEFPLISLFYVKLQCLILNEKMTQFCIQLFSDFFGTIGFFDRVPIQFLLFNCE